MFSCYIDEHSVFVGCTVRGRSKRPELFYNKDNAGVPSWKQLIKVGCPDGEPEEVVMALDLIQPTISVSGMYFKDLLDVFDIKEIVPGEWTIDDVRKVGALAADGILITDKGRRFKVVFKSGKLTIEELVLEDDSSLTLFTKDVCYFVEGLDCFNIDNNFILFLMTEIFSFMDKGLSFGMFNVYHDDKLVTLPLKLDKENIDAVVGNFEELLRGLE